MKKHTIIMAGLAASALGGCIQVKAPDKPIEINLNVNCLLYTSPSPRD